LIRLAFTENSKEESSGGVIGIEQTLREEIRDLRSQLAVAKADPAVQYGSEREMGASLCSPTPERRRFVEDYDSRENDPAYHSHDTALGAVKVCILCIASICPVCFEVFDPAGSGGKGKHVA
jgi:hypothetical protein